MPLRKKLNLEIARGNNDISTIRARNAGTNTVEYEGLSSSMGNLSSPTESYTADRRPEYVLKLPVPEKAQKQYNFCLMPKMDQSSEPLLWTVNDGAPLQIQVHDSKMQSHIGESDRVLEAALEYSMRDTKKKVTYPDEEEFVSATPESHRKGEKAYHVKAFKGSKDGKQYLLPTLEVRSLRRRLSLLPFGRCLLRLQKAAPILSIRRHQLHIIYICSAADLQSCNSLFNLTPESRRERSRVLHD